MMNLKVAGQLSEQDEEEEKSCELLVVSFVYSISCVDWCTVYSTVTHIDFSLYNFNFNI